ncbi:MAG: hypothetical protein GY705_21090, partial [Bacteroidetes bacterium]|nr:hypothetical protein [Bacteroidota bacterium]
YLINTNEDSSPNPDEIQPINSQQDHTSDQDLAYLFVTSEFVRQNGVINFTDQDKENQTRLSQLELDREIEKLDEIINTEPFRAFKEAFRYGSAVAILFYLQDNHSIQYSETEVLSSF